MAQTEYEKKLKKALKVKFKSDVSEDEITIKQYLHLLLETLWIEGEGFSSKRPFGNSGWELELIAPLIKAGFVEGTLDDEGCVLRFGTDYGFVIDLIYISFFGKID